MINACAKLHLNGVMMIDACRKVAPLGGVMMLDARAKLHLSGVMMIDTCRKVAPFGGHDD
jgi:hypothetical protein